jgi:hypothetical protein
MASSLHAVGLLNRVLGSRQDRFARRVLETIKKTGVADASYDSDEFAIRLRQTADDAEHGTAYLHNIYRELASASRSEQRDRIETFVRAVVFAPELPSEWDLVAPLLRPVLRPGTFGFGTAHGLVLQSRPAGLPFLAEYVVIDQPDSMAYVTTNHHELWHVTPKVVFDTARRNIATDEPTLPAGLTTSPRMIRLVEGGDAYWASRLLLAGGLVQFADRVGGRPVAFVPDTGGVTVMNDDPAAVAGYLASVEQEYREAARPLSPQAYTVDADGQIVVYPAPADHPAAERVHRASLVLAAAEYASQAEALASSESAFVAKLIVAEGNDRVFTVASWAEGVDTLLPRADYVAFSGSEGDAFLVAWRIVEQEATLIPVYGLRPDRYRVRSWPPADVIRTLRAHAAQI